MNDSVSRLVVCGTDTDVGKTVVSAWPVSYTHLTLPTMIGV